MGPKKIPMGHCYHNGRHSRTVIIIIEAVSTHIRTCVNVQVCFPYIYVHSYSRVCAYACA